MTWERNFMRAGAVFDRIASVFMTIELEVPNGLAPAPILMAANHRSLADVFIALISCYRLERPTQFIVGRKFFKRPGMGWFLRTIGCIEGGRRSGAGTVAIEAMRNGHSTAIMPEGAIKTMEPGHLLAPLLPGVSEIWQQSQRPFHAVGITGSGDVWPDGRFFPPLPKRKSRRPLVTVRVSEAVLPGDDECTLDRVTAIMEANCVASESIHKTHLAVLPRR